MSKCSTIKSQDNKLQGHRPQESDSIVTLLEKYLVQFSHKLKNSISAADGVLGDRLSGFSLTDDDFRDAKQALERVKLLISEMDAVVVVLEAGDEVELAKMLIKVEDEN